MRAAREPRRLELVRSKLARAAAVSGHRAIAPGRHERADRAVSPLDRAEDLDPEGRQPLAHELARLVGAGLADESRSSAELRRPGGHVRGLTAWPDADLRVRVPAGRDRRGKPDDDVEREISERADEHGERHRKIRAWTVNGAVACEPFCSEGSSAHRRPSRPRTGVGDSSDAEGARAGSLPSRAHPATSSCSSGSATRTDSSPAGR